jgi:hypothetical protein
MGAWPGVVGEAGTTLAHGRDYSVAMSATAQTPPANLGDRVAPRDPFPGLERRADA